MPAHEDAISMVALWESPARPETGETGILVYGHQGVLSAEDRSRNKLSRTRTAYHVFALLIGARIGHPACIESMFFGDEEYLIPMPDLIRDHRDIFITKALHAQLLVHAEMSLRAMGDGFEIQHARRALKFRTQAAQVARGLPPTPNDPTLLGLFSGMEAGGRANFEEKYASIVVPEYQRTNDPPPVEFIKVLSRGVIDSAFRNGQELIPATACVRSRPTDAGGNPLPEKGTATWWESWGPIFWKEVHQWALARPKKTKDWLRAFGDRIPCGTCKTHWLEMMGRTPPPENPDRVFDWTVDRHNEVNERLLKSGDTSKRVVSHEEAKLRWTE